MKKNILSFLVIIILTSNYSYSQNKNSGYIHKVKITSHESMMEKAVVKNKDQSIFYTPYNHQIILVENLTDHHIKKYNIDTKVNQNSIEMLNVEEVNTLMNTFCDVITNHTKNNSTSALVTKSKKGSVLLSKIGNVGNLSTGQPKISFHFPNKKLKKVKKIVDEYYEINIKFIYGGGTSTRIVMNKQKGDNTLKFKVKVDITAKNKKGKILWSKSQEVKDFKKSFEESDILVDKKNKFFKIKRKPRLFHKYFNKPIGNIFTLSKKEYMSVAQEALEETLKG